VSIDHLICTGILTVHRVHQAARHLYQSWRQTTKSWPQRDAAHHKEANLS
jgi:nicotinamidase-related amidase